MNFQVNFQKAKRNYLVATFEDEKDGKECEKRIWVGMPKKKVFDALIEMQRLMERKKRAETEEEKIDIQEETIDELYELTARILSNNKACEIITKEWVENTLDTGELEEFFDQYIKFTQREASSPN